MRARQPSTGWLCASIVSPLIPQHPVRPLPGMNGQVCCRGSHLLNRHELLLADFYSLAPHPPPLNSNTRLYSADMQTTFSLPRIDSMNTMKLEPALRKARALGNSNISQHYVTRFTEKLLARVQDLI